MKRFKRLTIAFFAVLLLIPVLMYLLVRGMNQSLIGIGSKALPCADTDFLFLSNTDILVPTITTTSTQRPGRHNSEDADADYNKVYTSSLTASRVNTVSGVSTPISGLKLESDNKEPKLNTLGWRTSPDRRRVLVSFDMGEYERGSQFAEFDLESGRTASIANEYSIGEEYSLGDVCWLPDGKKLIIGERGQSQSFALLNTDTGDEEAIVVELYHLRFSPLGVRADNVLIGTAVPDASDSEFHIYEHSLTNNPAANSDNKVPLPAGSTVLESTLSPDSRTVALLISTVHAHPLYRYVKRFAPKYAQRFVINYYWELPVPKYSGFKGKVLDDWAMSGIIQFQSGFPIRIQTQDDNELISSLFFLGAGAPQQTGSLQILNPKKNGGFYLNPAQFSDPALGSFATTPRSICCGPGENQFDVTFSKRITLSEAQYFQFRADVFNLFNKTEFVNPDGNFSNTTFGQVLQARDPRAVQFALKFYF